MTENNRSRAYLHSSQCGLWPGICRRFSWMLLFMASFAGAAEQVDINSLLTNMQEAEEKVSFEGIFIYQRVGNNGNGADDQMDTVRVVHHATEDGGVRERLVALTGEPREVIRDIAGVRTLFPQQRYVLGGERHDLLFTLLISRPQLELAKNYDLSAERGGRVAGRATWKLQVMPKDRYRYTHNLWLDEESGLLLRSDVSDQNGRILERLMFTRIKFEDDISESLLSPAFSTEGFSWNEDAHLVSQKDVDDSRWQVGWIPDGFKKLHHERIASGKQFDPIEHLIFTDGLAMISMFIEQKGNGDSFACCPLQVITMRGGLRVFTSSMRGYQITIMGDVPSITVERMVGSVTWNTDPTHIAQ